jgi:carbamoyl-phosphate synthase small subunit
VGNYGVPCDTNKNPVEFFESTHIQVKALVISHLSSRPSHWTCSRTLNNWLAEQDIPGISGIDTRALTKRLRESGTMLGRITANDPVEFYDCNKYNLVSEVSVSEPQEFNGGAKKVILVDCGLKMNILRSLLDRGVSVKRVGWDYDYTKEDFDGILVSNGPGDPEKCATTIDILKRAVVQERPTMGICLGNQLLALATGGETYKLKYGHRSQNQPCIDKITGKCYITSQNHGFAVSEKNLPSNMEVWFENLNDGTVEGIRHKSLPITATQFHPEDCPGPTDTRFIFDEFIKKL